MLLIAYSQPPLSEPAHPTATYLFTAFLGVFFVGLVAWCVFVARRERTWLPLACLVGGLLSFGFEPVLDAVGHIFYPVGTPLTVVTIFDTSIPFFTVMAYIFWMGAGTLLIARWLERGRSGRDVLTLFAAVVVLEACFEYPAVLSKTLIYFGDAPFKLFDFPLHWAFGNTAAVLVTGYALYLARPYLSGAGGFVLAALIPALGYFAISAMGSWPVWLALNSEVPMAVIWLAGAAAIALDLLFVRLVALAVDRGVALRPAAPPPAPAQPVPREPVRA